MNLKLKHRLPTTSVLDHLCLDEKTLADLVSCVNELKSQFKSVIEVNNQLCGIHHKLASNVYENFFQIALTNSHHETQTDLESCQKTYEEINQGSRTEAIRKKKALATDKSSAFNEHSYRNRNEVYEQYKNLFEKILNPVKGQTTRVRLVKLAAGTSVAPHIDYDPSYAVRVIIPVISNSECLNVFWVQNKIETVHLEPGKAYFLNTGYKHAVINLSNEDRYTFMFSINGTEDIHHLLKSPSKLPSEDMLLI